MVRLLEDFPLLLLLLVLESWRAFAEIDAELFGFLDGNTALLSHLTLYPVTVPLLAILVSFVSLPLLLRVT